MDVGGVIGLLIGLAVVVALAFYFVSNYEDPPLWSLRWKSQLSAVVAEASTVT